MTNPATDETEEVKNDVKDQKFYNQHEGLYGRAPGEYLDVHEREDAELTRAKVEDRKPNLKNPPSVAGTPLITEQQFKAAGPTAQSEPLDINQEPKPVTTLPVDVTSAADAATINRDHDTMLQNEAAARVDSQVEVGSQTNVDALTEVPPYQSPVS